MMLPMANLSQLGTQTVMVMHWWDSYPVSFAAEAVSKHNGFGRPITCEVSGEIFPESRIMQQWDGKLVGDLYYTLGPRPFPY